jgi:hypothetical protein
MKLTKLALMGTFLLAPFAATAEPDLASVGEDGIIRPAILNPC